MTKSLDHMGRVIHEANRAVALSANEDMPNWDDAEDWQKESTLNGIREVIRNPDITPVEIHEAWKKSKIDDGWTYGKVKDAKKKTHPCIVDYDELPEIQRLKDDLFLAIVKAFLKMVE